MVDSQQLAKRARIYDAQERASDHGIGRPGGPTGWRKPRAPSAIGNAARMRRLRKQAPALHAKVLAGTITVWEAVAMAGFNRPQQHKPTVERTITSLQEQELWLGASHRGSLFASDEERRRQWVKHRDRLMQLFANNGRRPQAWWRYEAPFKYPGFNRERSALWEAGLLGAAEAQELERSWHEEFNRSLEPGFIFNDGPRGELSGWEAHIAHLVACDVPADLCELWAAAPEAA
jgi:hypothetical protein